MKAVSNTTPLQYLIAIEQKHLLGQQFEKVFVPVAVHEELTDSKTPETVRGRVLSMPTWFEVRTVQETQTTAFPVTLHRGERQAILLAEAGRESHPLKAPGLAWRTETSPPCLLLIESSNA
jgi:predicted nucleic acid-binding protein